MIAYAFANLPLLVAILFVALFIGRFFLGARATEVHDTPRAWRYRQLNPRILRRIA